MLRPPGEGAVQVPGLRDWGRDWVTQGREEGLERGKEGVSSGELAEGLLRKCAAVQALLPRGLSPICLPV